MGTIIVGSILAGTVCLVIRSMVRDKKSGRTACGGDCSRCRGCH